MGSAKPPETPCMRMIEAPVGDVFISGVCPPEDHGSFVRIKHYVVKTDAQSGENYREMILPIVMTKESWAEIARMFQPIFRSACEPGDSMAAFRTPAAKITAVKN